MVYTIMENLIWPMISRSIIHHFAMFCRYLITFIVAGSLFQVSVSSTTYYGFTATPQPRIVTWQVLMYWGQWLVPGHSKPYFYLNYVIYFPLSCYWYNNHVLLPWLHICLLLLCPDKQPESYGSSALSIGCIVLTPSAHVEILHCSRVLFLSLFEAKNKRSEVNNYEYDPIYIIVYIHSLHWHKVKVSHE